MRLITRQRLDEKIEAGPMMRVLPELTVDNETFWTGGARGELMIAHCDACDHAIHPPQPLAPCAAEGGGTIIAKTVNRQRWSQDMAVSLALAVVEPDGEPGVRITARIVDCDPETVAIGDRVTVAFEQDRDV